MNADPQRRPTLFHLEVMRRGARSYEPLRDISGELIVVAANSRSYVDTVFWTLNAGRYIGARYSPVKQKEPNQ
jgi:hypothetical protein